MGNVVIRIDSGGWKRPQARGQSSSLVHYSIVYGMAVLAEELFMGVCLRGARGVLKYVQVARRRAAFGAEERKA